ncbi:MAG: GGDEF domain-containing protein [Deinococcales bacterium]
MKRRTVVVAASVVVLVVAAALSYTASQLALPLAALVLTATLVGSGSRMPAWRLAAAGSALWTIEEGIWAFVRLSGGPSHLVLTDIATYGGTTLWVAALLLLSTRRSPTLLSLPFLPALGLLVWIDTRDVPLVQSLRFPVVDIILVLATLPALEAALRGRASEGRLLWTFGFFVRALTAGTMSWLYAVPGLGHAFYVLWLLPYAFVAIGVAMELSDQESGMWAAAATILGLEAVSGIMLTLLYRSGLIGGPATVGIVLLLAYVQFVGIMLVLLSDRQRRIRAEHELKAWGEVIDRVVTVEPGELGTVGTLRGLLDALAARMPHVSGVEVYADGQLRAGEPRGYAFPLVSAGTEVGRLYFTRQPRETSILDAVTPFLAGRIQQALDQAEWRTRAITDPLTGLLNRRGIDLQSTELLLRSRDHGRPVTVAMLDLDHFKRVNDFYDHATGDRALREVASILERHLRDNDLAARWGGEEFLVMLYDADRGTTIEVVKRIRAELRGRILPPIAWPLTLSVGVAGGEVPDGSTMLESWIQQADRALIQAKDAGRDRIQAVA